MRVSRGMETEIAVGSELENVRKLLDPPTPPDTTSGDPLTNPQQPPVTWART